LDSYPNVIDHEKNAKNINHYLQFVWNSNHENSNLTIKLPLEIPKVVHQRNATDCGVWAVAFFQNTCIDAPDIKV
jgi:Ulp1 family protease